MEDRMGWESLGYFAESVREFAELSPVFRNRKWEIVAIIEGDAHVAVPRAPTG
jgi:hypothetical protein